MTISHHQSLADVGSKNRSLMLKKGSYVPWVSCFMRYIDEKSDPIVQPHKRPQKEEDLTGDDKQLFEADIDEMTDISKQEKDSRLSKEFDKFTFVSGECIESVYEYFSRLMNDMDRNEILPKQIATNTKTSSNTRNQSYVQDGRIDVQTKNMRNVGSAGRNTGHNFESSETAAYVQKANGNTTTVKRVPRINANSRYTPTVQCYNFSEKGHYSRECPKPRV
ncbi:retrovirus-related pol polyprotein from transposon TNT 1-94 [Tanacetum coccineum]